MLVIVLYIHMESLNILKRSSKCNIFPYIHFPNVMLKLYVYTYTFLNVSTLLSTVIWSYIYFFPILYY